MSQSTPKSAAAQSAMTPKPKTPAEPKTPVLAETTPAKAAVEPKTPELAIEPKTVNEPKTPAEPKAPETPEEPAAEPKKKRGGAKKRAPVVKKGPPGQLGGRAGNVFSYAHTLAMFREFFNSQYGPACIFSKRVSPAKPEDIVVTADGATATAPAAAEGDGKKKFKFSRISPKKSAIIMLSSLSELLIKKFVHSLFVYTRHTNKTRVSTETVIEYLASDGRNPMFRQFILSFYREWRETYQAQLESNDDARIVDAKTGKVAKTVQPAPVHPMKLEIPRLAPEVPSSELVNIVQVVPKDSPQKPVGGRKEAVPATEKKSVRSSAESFINQSLKQTVACKKLIKDLKLQFAEKKSTITIANEIYSFLSDLYNKLVMHILRNIMYIFTVTEKRTVVPEHVKAAYNALFESMRSQNQTASSDFALFREVSREATERTESFDKSANKNNIEHINRRIASNEAKLADLTFPLEKAGAVQKALAKDKQALARLSADVEVKEKKQPRKPAGEEEAEVKEADGDEEETETKEDGDEPEGDENTDNADEIDD